MTLMLIGCFDTMQEAQDTWRCDSCWCGGLQVCWHKFTRYWEVDEKLVPVKEGVWVATAKDLVAACDENTIGGLPCPECLTRA